MSQINATQVSDEIIQELTNAIQRLRYGSVEITVHDGRVTQIERREKVRFQSPSDSSSQKSRPIATN